MSMKIIVQRRLAANELGFILVLRQNGKEIVVQPEWQDALEQAMNLVKRDRSPSMIVDNTVVKRDENSPGGYSNTILLPYEGRGNS